MSGDGQGPFKLDAKATAFRPERVEQPDRADCGHGDKGAFRELFYIARAQPRRHRDATASAKKVGKLCGNGGKERAVPFPTRRMPLGVVIEYCGAQLPQRMALLPREPGQPVVEKTRMHLNDGCESQVSFLPAAEDDDGLGRLSGISSYENTISRGTGETPYAIILSHSRPFPVQNDSSERFIVSSRGGETRKRDLPGISFAFALARL